MKFLRNAVIAFLILVLGGVLGYRMGTGNLPWANSLLSQAVPQLLVNTVQPNDFQQVNFEQFWEVWRLLERNYYDPSKFTVQDLVDGAISGLTQGTGDPYTVYLDAERKQFTQEQLEGSFYGVGIQLGYIDGTLAAIAPLKDTPAEQAGIQAGDLILEVRDKSKNLESDTAGWSLDEAVSNIRGKRGTSVEFTLLRPNDQNPQPFQVSVERAEITVPTVELTFVEHAGKRVAHLQVFTFNDQTDDEWDKAVRQIQAQNNLAGIILDVRNNPGGLLDQSVEMASDFIPDGVIVTQSGKYSNQSLRSTGSGRLVNYPVEVLVNKGSASASEIVAGAIRDRLGAKLIGTQTFGKGTVQDRIILSNGGALHVTIARWLLPAGDWIQDEGIPVDIEVEDDPETEQDEVLLRAIEEL